MCVIINRVKALTVCMVGILMKEKERMNEIKIALQLWSIKEACEENFEDSLRKVATMGYDGVEFAGFYGLEATTLKALLDENELQVAASHISYDALKNNFEEVIAYEKTIGNQNIVVPFLQADSLDEWYTYFDNLKVWQEEITAQGMNLFYHNHAHEFTQIQGKDMMKEMLIAVPNLLVELDTYWVKYAGVDVLNWLKDHQISVRLLHIKEMLETAKGYQSTEIGNGIMPIEDLVNFAKNQHIEWLIIEQEAFQNNKPLESAQVNIKQLSKII